jgi:uncharacterized membrane protein YebE (DUF533 family)
MQLTLKVELPDNTYTVTTNLYVVVAWERKFKRKASDMANGIGIEDLAYLAFEAYKLNKIVVPAEFDNFIKQLVNIEVVEQEQPSFTEAAPTDAN